MPACGGAIPEAGARHEKNRACPKSNAPSARIQACQKRRCIRRDGRIPNTRPKTAVRVQERPQKQDGVSYQHWQARHGAPTREGQSAVLPASHSITCGAGRRLERPRYVGAGISEGTLDRMLRGSGDSAGHKSSGAASGQGTSLNTPTPCGTRTTSDRMVSVGRYATMMVLPAHGPRSAARQARKQTATTKSCPGVPGTCVVLIQIIVHAHLWHGIHIPLRRNGDLA